MQSVQKAAGLSRNRKQKVICPLCGNDVEKFHRRSHLVPEWMYRECYDEKHKVIEVVRCDQKATRRQKGIYHIIMCADCEGESQKYDHYASMVLTDRTSKGAELATVKKEYFREPYDGKELTFAMWQGLDFKKLQNFVLSVVLRAHFANTAKDYTLLIPKHLNNILALYRGSHLDDSSYPIIIFERPEQDDLRDFVVQPYLIKKDGHNVIEFAGGGYHFYLYVSSHRKPRSIESLSLKKDGSVYVLVVAIEETSLFQGMLRLVSSLKKIPRGMERTK